MLQRRSPHATTKARCSQNSLSILECGMASHLFRSYFMPFDVILQFLCVSPMCPVDSQLVTQSCRILYDPMNCNLSGSFVHEILQAGKLECIAILFSRGSSWPRNWTCTSYITGRFFIIWATREGPTLFAKWQYPVLGRMQCGEGNGTPLRYSCLENPMDRGAW